MEKYWSKLPSDLLLVVTDHLGLPDLLRFGAVCRSWQAVVCERCCLGLSLPKIPWFCLKSSITSGKEKVQLYRTAEFDRLTPNYRFYSTIQHTEPEIRYIGSGHGWLVVVVSKTCDLSLLNPITGKKIDLPNFSSAFVDPLISRKVAEGSLHLHLFIGKGILTSPPDDHRNECIVFLMAFGSSLVYARPGRDKTWTFLPTDSLSHRDVVCHGGRIYRAGWRIVSWDLIGGPNTVVELKPEFSCQRHDPVLVSSPWGDLLYVIIPRHYLHCAGTVRMEVYRVDFEKRDLVEVESIGEHAIFVSDNSSMCLSVSTELPHLQRDCIYFNFKNDYIEESLGGPQRNRGIGIYNMEDGTIRFSELGELMTESSSITWFLPSLA